MSIAVTSPSNAAASLATTSAQAGADASGVNSEQRFLKLLVAQLNNQDPLSPMQNAELTSQLAQMSTVSGIEKLNGALQTLLNQSAAGQVLQATSLVGHTVLVPGAEIAGGNGPSSFAIDLPSSAGSVKVMISDAAGNAVRTLDLGALPQGLQTLRWDGASDKGEAVAAGQYQIKVNAVNETTAVQASSLTFSSVNSVTQNTAGVVLDLASGQSVALSNVRTVQ